ncbi:hypothetical protein L1281_002035 [Neisseria sp. HSC-16F19]|nr:hypothetical protein [Neisseria sp. HSC-16F19]MCP2041435.1 hypothetical protein [Neisseria sp. HSC-16F19]
MKHALILTLAAAAALAACKPQEKTEVAAATTASAPAAAPAAGGNGNWGSRQLDYDTFVTSCISSLPEPMRTDPYKNYCSCMGNYVLSKYDDAFFRRMEAAVARGEGNTGEFQAFQEDMVTNGLKACPLPTN